ncbi:MAG: glycosyltransferase family 2 protein [Thermoplasmata archaeon]
MGAEPEVAVIVGDWGRRRYLGSALKSLDAQTLARARFEVVVTKNYRDPKLDRALDEAGVTALFDEERRIGRWLRRAVNASRAPILTFLDDDDEFEPERLAQVVETFARFPDLGFYRNRVAVIDRDGRPVPRESWRSLEVDPEFDRLGPVHIGADDPDRIVDLATRRTFATFNSSTMALRRELLVGDVGDAFERTQLPDQFLFLAAVLARRGIYLDDRRLTRYRFYPGNVTREVPWLGHAEDSYRDMTEVAARHGHPEVAAWLSGRAVHYGRMFRGGTLVTRVVAGAPRREVARRTAEYLRYLARHPEERQWTLDIWAAGAYGLGYVPLGPLASRLARARVTTRPAV